MLRPIAMTMIRLDKGDFDRKIPVLNTQNNRKLNTYIDEKHKHEIYIWNLK